MKGNVPGNSSLTDRVSGAMGAASDSMDQAKHDGSAEGKYFIDQFSLSHLLTHSSQPTSAPSKRFVILLLSDVREIIHAAMT